MIKVFELSDERKAELWYSDNLTIDDFLRIMMWIHMKISSMNW